MVTKSGIESRARHVRSTICGTVRSERRIRSWRSSLTTASSRSEGRSAGQSSATRFSFSPDSISTFSTSPNVVEFLDGSSKVVPQARTGPYTPGRLRGHRSGDGICRRGATHGRLLDNIRRRRLATLPLRNSTSISRRAINSRCDSAPRGTGERTTFSSIRPAPSLTIPTATTAQEIVATETASLVADFRIVAALDQPSRACSILAINSSPSATRAMCS